MFEFHLSILTFCVVTTIQYAIFNCALQLHNSQSLNTRELTPSGRHRAMLLFEKLDAPSAFGQVRSGSVRKFIACFY